MPIQGHFLKIAPVCLYLKFAFKTKYKNNKITLYRNTKMTLFDPRLKKRNYKEINTVQELYAVLFEPHYKRASKLENNDCYSTLIDNFLEMKLHVRKVSYGSNELPDITESSRYVFIDYIEFDNNSKIIRIDWICDNEIEAVTPKQLLSKYQLEVKKDFWIPFGFYKGSCITNFLRLIGFYK